MNHPESIAARIPLTDTARLLARPPRRSLVPGCVQLWAWSLDVDVVARRAAHALLDEDERDRAARFIRQEHRDRFVVAHGVLRAVLAAYVDAMPDALRFVRSVGGKPALEGSPVSFNLSHSAARAVLAVGLADLGVDVEHPRARLDPLGLAARYFFGAEHEAIRSAPPAEQAATFLRYWVAKEAVLKAQGVGLAFPLDAFAIDFAGDGATARVTSNDPARLRPSWTVRLLWLESGWPVAVAMDGQRWSVSPSTLTASSR